MNPTQKRIFLEALVKAGIDHKLGNGGEVAILCPVCSSHAHNRRRTLGVNVNNDKWNCFRCAPKLRGRDPVPLLKILKLNDIVSAFEEGAETVILEDDSLEKMKRRLLFGNQDVEQIVNGEIKLPKEYRTDWENTIIGKSLLNHLLGSKRKLSLKTIAKYNIGYAVSGEYSGCIVIPVYMKGKLKFWQVRRTMMYTSKDPKYDGPKAGRRSVLYGYDDIESEVIVVEGVFDKLGLIDLTSSAVALLGKSISDEQINLLAGKEVTKVTVMLDGAAWGECKTVAYTIAKKLWTAKNVCAARLPFGTDPGTLGARALSSATHTLVVKP